MSLDSITRLNPDLFTAIRAMGYNAKGPFNVFLSPASAQEDILDAANTPWALKNSSEVLYGEVTMDAGAEEVRIVHDITLPQSPGSGSGWRITSFDVYYTVGVAALTAADFSLKKTTLPAATGSAPTCAAETVTGTETLTTGDRKVTMTVTTPAVYDSTLEALRLDLSFTMANTGVLKYYGTKVNFELVDA